MCVAVSQVWWMWMFEQDITQNSTKQNNKRREDMFERLTAALSNCWNISFRTSTSSMGACASVVLNTVKLTMSANSTLP